MNCKLTTYLKLALLSFFFLAFTIATSTTSLAATCSVNCLSIFSIELSNLGSSVRGIVKLVDETGSGGGARGTVVHGIWTRPDGTTLDQYANIGTRLRATFSLYTAGASGKYKFTVAGATKPDYAFDPSNSSRLSKTIIIGEVSNQSPVAVPNADFINGSAPLVVTFDSSGSFDPDGVIVDYAWDFDDGNISQEANPVNTYDAPGSFTATLMVTDDKGATASQSIPITVTESDGVCISNCMSVDRVALSYKKKRNMVKGLVWVVDEDDSAVRDAVVHATWTLPDGSVFDQYSTIGSRLRASFSLQTEIAGTHVLKIVEITKPGYSFDLDNSNVLNGIIDVNP